jgi:hypothetical protein
VTQVLANIGPVLGQQELSRAVAAGQRVAQLEHGARDAEAAQIAKELPGTLGTLTPIYGSLRTGGVQWRHGNYVTAVIYFGFAVSDVAPVKALALGVGKLALN